MVSALAAGWREEEEEGQEGGAGGGRKGGVQHRFPFIYDTVFDLLRLLRFLDGVKSGDFVLWGEGGGGGGAELGLELGEEIAIGGISLGT